MSTHERWLEELWDEEDRLAAAAEELEATEERKAAERKATEERKAAGTEPRPSFLFPSRSNRNPTAMT